MCYLWCWFNWPFMGSMSSLVSGNCSDLKISFNFLERAITHHMGKAQELGATIVLNGREENIVQQIKSSTNSKKMDVDRIITKKIKLDDIVKDGFEALSRDSSEIKILVDVASN